MSFESSLKLSGQFVGDRQKLGRVQNRLPDLTDQAKPLRNRELADFGDVSH